MEENRRSPDFEHIDNPDVRHEHKDVNVRALVKFAIAFIVAGIAVHLFLWFVFGYFRGGEAAAVPSPSEGIGVDAVSLPPEPRLQAAPIRDLMEMRAAENEILDGYGWVDRQAGAVRIPIDRAMDLVAKEGLPAAPSAASPAAQPVTVPSNSGLGPVMTQVGGPLSPNRTWAPRQPLELRGQGRQAGGPPTPPEYSLGDAVGGITPPRPGQAR